MEKNKKRKFTLNILKDSNKLTKAFAITSCVLIFILSFIFFHFGDLAEITMSAVGNKNLPQRIMFIAWGIIMGFCSSVFLIRLFNTLNYKSVLPRILLLLATIFIFICTLIPSKAGMPEVNKWHILFAVLSPVFFILSIVVFLTKLSYVDKRAGKVCWQIFLFSMISPVLMYIMYGHCGMYEVAFYMSISVFFVGISAYLLKDNKSIDMSKPLFSKPEQIEENQILDNTEILEQNEKTI